MNCAKRARRTQQAKPEPPRTLTLKLHAPGMTPLHRAGLGGLACTLKYIERARKSGALSDGELPGGAWKDGASPWQIDEQSITLDFGEPRKAGEFLKRLFAIGFGLKDGMIYLPGQYGVEPPPAVRAKLQAALQLSFLQHGPSCGSRRGEQEQTYDVDGQEFAITHDVFTSYKHQGWYWIERNARKPADDTRNIGTRDQRSDYKKRVEHALSIITPEGTLHSARSPVDTALVPGAIVRHDGFKASAIAADAAEIVCAHFAVVGCLALAVNRIVGVVMIPEVTGLLTFAISRPLMTPTTVQECSVGSAADAVLQAHLRVRAKREISCFDLAGATTMTFRPTSWAPQLKSRVSIAFVPRGDEKRLARFEAALSELQPRIDAPIVSRRRGQPSLAKEGRHYWVDSKVRPLVADNLAAAMPWYAGFVRLMTGVNGGKPVRDNIRRYEGGGLNAMIKNDQMWDHDSELTVVRAIHEALRRRYGRIASENQGNKAARQNRLNTEYERWRLAFAGASTAVQFRHALCDLFSRGGANEILRTDWADLLPMLSLEQWQLTRDLALLALPSYTSTADRGTTETVRSDGDVDDHSRKEEEP